MPRSRVEGVVSLWPILNLKPIRPPRSSQDQKSLHTHRFPFNPDSVPRVKVRVLDFTEPWGREAFAFHIPYSQYIESH